jgi:uncharacterized protein YcnI
MAERLALLIAYIKIVTSPHDDVDSELKTSVGKTFSIPVGKDGKPSTASLIKPATGTAISNPSKPPMYVPTSKETNTQIGRNPVKLPKRRGAIA